MAEAGDFAVRRRRLLVLLAVVATLAVALAGIRAYLSRAAEDRIRKGEIVDFQAMPAQSPTPRFLVCPRDFCSAPADAEAPVFDVPWETLRDRWSAIVALQPRLRLVAGDGEMTRISYVQHSWLFQLPDLVTIEFVPLGEHRSTFAVVSQSRYGFYDFGANSQRIHAWLRQLREAPAAPPG